MYTLQEFTQNVQKYADKKKVTVLSTYENGNFYVGICSDGTRIKETIDPAATSFSPAFALNADVKITNHCTAGCKFCHENSSPSGIHANLNLPIFDTWKPGTEMAIGGGNVLDHPDLIPFLQKMKQKGVIRNITVNQKAVTEQFELVQSLIQNQLINGIGVSITDPGNQLEMSKVDEVFAMTDNAVAHVIVGYVSKNFLPALKGKKVLFLGYKNNVGRGVAFGQQNKESIATETAWLKAQLKHLTTWCKVLSFDNLALEQLDVKSTLQVPQEVWDLRFQGKDYGSITGKDAPTTFYFDAVSNMIGRSSTQPYSERIPYTGQSFEEAFKDSLSNYKVNEDQYGALKLA